MKQQLRQEMLARRGRLAPEEVEVRSAKIKERLLNTSFYRQAGTVMLYLDFRNEVKTGAIIEDAWKAGKNVVVPVCQRENLTILPALIKSYQDLAPGTLGILEPKPENLRPAAEANIDLVIVPGVAFDRQGNRLGYGAGYYDRFLPHLRPDAVTAALAFDLQVVPAVDAEPYDRAVQWLVTESGAWRCQ